MTSHRPACRARLAGKLSLLIPQALLFAAISASGRAQSAPAASFEVATVKPSDTRNPSSPSVSITPDQFAATGMTLKELIKIAYDMNYGGEQQISGGPAWVSSERFDLLAKEDEALSMELEKLPEEQQGVRIREMLRVLLGQRFHLQLHHESKDLPVYELVAAKGGPKLMPAVAQTSPVKDGDTPAKPRSWIRFAGRGRLEGNEADSPMLVTVLSMQPEIGGRLVLDKTGLTGKYDFTLRWTPDMAQGADPGTDAGPSLFTALEEELGLRLEPAKAPVDMIVIDHVDLPSAN